LWPEHHLKSEDRAERGKGIQLDLFWSVFLVKRPLLLTEEPAEWHRSRCYGAHLISPCLTLQGARTNEPTRQAVYLYFEAPRLPEVIRKLRRYDRPQLDDGVRAATR